LTTEDDFRRVIDANPSDWQTLLVFSDWLRERNDPRADGYTALAVRRQVPYNHGRQWCWWGQRSGLSAHRRKPNLLPDDWYAALERAPSQSFARESQCPSDLFDFAARAFSKLPPERRAELLAPSV
jgi:uncharacterized protein (TIGR02996 family)